MIFDQSRWHPFLASCNLLFSEKFTCDALSNSDFFGIFEELNSAGSIASRRSWIYVSHHMALDFERLGTRVFTSFRECVKLEMKKEDTLSAREKTGKTGLKLWKLEKTGQNSWKLGKTGQHSWRSAEKLGKTGENWAKLVKIKGNFIENWENWGTLGKTGENWGTLGNAGKFNKNW